MCGGEEEKEEKYEEKGPKFFFHSVKPKIWLFRALIVTYMTEGLNRNKIDNIRDSLWTFKNQGPQLR